MDDRLLQLMTRSERDAVMAPISDAMTLPSQAFTSDAWYALEVERIIARNWTGTMFGCELPDAGDAAPFDLIDRPLFAVRGDDGHLRVFHNIVPYDGCLAVLAPSKRLEAIETPYHGLRYDFRGRLVAAPYWDGRPDSGPEALGGRDGDLVEVRSEERLGVLFINLDRSASGIDDWLEPWRTLVAGDYAIDRLVPARDSRGNPLIERRTVRSNWKNYQENASINLLHEGFTHELHRKSQEVPRAGADGKSRFELTMEGALVAFAHSRSHSGETYDPIRLPTAGHDVSVQPEWGYFTTLYPNINIPLPTGPGETEHRHLRF